MTNFRRDEFDNIPESSSRQGVHRTAMGQPRSGLWPIVAFAVVALAIGAAAFFIVPKILDRAPAAAASSSATQPTTPSTNSTPAASQTPSSDATTSAPPAPSSSPSQTTPRPPVADKSLAVGVYNASGVTGLAARVTGQLKAEGWTVNQSGNWTGNAVNASVVYYKDAAAKPGAEEIAKSLGIATVAEADGAALPVLVVLGPGAQ